MNENKENYPARITANLADLGSLRCPICLEILKNPVELRCNHLFCVSCIDRCENGGFPGDNSLRHSKNNFKRIPKPRDKEEGHKNIRRSHKDAKDNSKNNVMAMTTSFNKHQRIFGSTFQNKENTSKILNEVKKGKVEKKNRNVNDRKMLICDKLPNSQNELINNQYVNEWIVNRYDVIYERPYAQKSLIKARTIKNENRLERASFTSSCSTTFGKNEKSIQKLNNIEGTTHTQNNNTIRFENKYHLPERERKQEPDFRNLEISDCWDMAEGVTKPIQYVCASVETSLRGAITEECNSVPDLQKFVPSTAAVQDNNHENTVLMPTEHSLQSKQPSKSVVRNSTSMKSEDEVILNKCDTLFSSFSDLTSQLSSFLMANDTPSSKLILMHKHLQKLQHKISNMSLILKENIIEANDPTTNQVTQTEKRKLRTSIVQTSPVKMSNSLRKKVSHQEVQIEIVTIPSSKTPPNEIKLINACVSADLDYCRIPLSYNGNQHFVDKAQNTEFPEIDRTVDRSTKDTVDKYLEKMKEPISFPLSMIKTNLNIKPENAKTEIKLYSADSMARCEQYKKFISLPNINDFTKTKIISIKEHELCKEENVPFIDPLKNNLKQKKIKPKPKTKKNVSLATLYGLNSDSIYGTSDSNLSESDFLEHRQEGIISIVQL